MKNRIAALAAAVVSFALMSTASAQSFYTRDGRAQRWEYGFDLLFQDSQNIDFKGGSTVDLDSDVGFRFIFGYHYTDHLEIEVALDYADVDYDATLFSADDPAASGRVHGTIESFTPRLSVTYNFMSAGLTPFVTGGIGYSFVDTNIPDGPPGLGCWWDPWWGNICTPYQPTRTINEFAYQLGIGVRWDASRTFSVRGAYEKQWIDLSNATSTPDLDVFRIGFGIKY